MNGLVLCTGANKTVGSLEFSKTRLQPLVKPRKREQLLLELEQEHEATGGEEIGGDEGSVTVSFCCSHIPQNKNARSHNTCVSRDKCQTP